MKRRIVTVVLEQLENETDDEFDAHDLKDVLLLGDIVVDEVLNDE